MVTQVALDIVGTDWNVWISRAKGGASISFTPAMSSDGVGVGVGVTEAKLKAEYTNLVPGGPNYNYNADGNPAARFRFRVADGKVTETLIVLKEQDCHN